MLGRVRLDRRARPGDGGLGAGEVGVDDVDVPACGVQGGGEVASPAPRPDRQLRHLGTEAHHVGSDVVESPAQVVAVGDGPCEAVPVVAVLDRCRLGGPGGFGGVEPRLAGLVDGRVQQAVGGAFAPGGGQRAGELLERIDLLRRAATGVVGAGVDVGAVGGGVDVVLVPAAGHGDVEVLAVQAGAGEGDGDVGGGALGGVDGRGPPVLGVPREVGGGQGGGAAPGEVRHDQAAAVGGGGQDGEPVAVADLVGADAQVRGCSSSP